MTDPPSLNFVLRPGEKNAERRRLAAARALDESLLDDPEYWLPAPGGICPRCGKDVPVPGRRGQYLGAASRTDAKTEICSACGQHEAAEEMSGRLTPQSGWPVEYTPFISPEVMTGWRDDWERVRSNRAHHPMPPPTPRELPDLRLHLLERWLEGGHFEQIVRYRQQIGMSEAGPPPRFGEWERRVLRNASLWWVKGEMVKLTTAAASTIPGDLTAREVDLPADQAYGLMVLAEPWMGEDSNAEKPCQVDAIAWGPSTVQGHPGLSMSFYRYLDFAGGLSPEDLRMASYTGLILDAQAEFAGETEAQIGARLSGGTWTWLGRTDWPLAELVTGFELLPPKPDERRAESMIEDRRWFSAFCALVNHKLSEQETVYSPRQTQRRATRAGVEPVAAASHVRLIRLREARHEHDDDEPGEHKHVDWTHRWMVGAHWAWRRCGPKGSQRKLVFIAPYVKGPEDKPLVLKDNVRVWVR